MISTAEPRTAIYVAKYNAILFTSGKFFVYTKKVDEQFRSPILNVNHIIPQIY